MEIGWLYIFRINVVFKIATDSRHVWLYGCSPYDRLPRNMFISLKDFLLRLCACGFEEQQIPRTS